MISSIFGVMFFCKVHSSSSLITFFPETFSIIIIVNSNNQKQRGISRIEDNIRSVINRVKLNLLKDKSCINNTAKKKKAVPIFVIT